MDSISSIQEVKFIVWYVYTSETYLPVLDSNLQVMFNHALTDD